MTKLDNAHALIIGVANYQNIPKLPASVLKDAEDIYNVLINPNHCGYVAENIQLLLDQQATQANIKEAFRHLIEKSNVDSTVLFYISSHGGQITAGEKAGEYLLPIDADFFSDETLANTSISGHEFTEFLRNIPAKKVLVIFDCCHAGGIGQTKSTDSSPLQTGFSDSYYEKLKQGVGRVILASSRSDEYSYILADAPNSLFTHHLLAGLKGGITSDDGLIRIFDLFEYIQPKVTADKPKQHPIFKCEIQENFPIALYLGGEKITKPEVTPGFRYDAYISYVDKEPDTTWVWDTLLPRLKNQGLKIAVSGDVEQAGVARVVNIERGISQAKRTIIVLSDNYLSDNMAEFENTLVQTMGIQEGTYRLLPVKKDSIDMSNLPTRLSMLTTLDLNHPRRAEREFERLIQALQSPLPTMK